MPTIIERAEVIQDKTMIYNVKIIKTKEKKVKCNNN